MSLPILDFLKQRTDERISELEVALRGAKGARRRLQKIAKSGQLHYKVKLISLWASEGEKDTETTLRGSLKKVIGEAIAQFKTTNNRSDVQAHWKVYVILPGKPRTEIELHEMYWGHYKPKGKT